MVPRRFTNKEDNLCIGSTTYHLSPEAFFPATGLFFARTRSDRASLGNQRAMRNLIVSPSVGSANDPGACQNDLACLNDADVCSPQSPSAQWSCGTRDVAEHQLGSFRNSASQRTTRQPYLRRRSGALTSSWLSRTPGPLPSPAGMNSTPALSRAL